MNTRVIAARHAHEYCNDPTTVYYWCDVLAIAEIIFCMMPQQGLQTVAVSKTIADICSAAEEISRSPGAKTEAFVRGLQDRAHTQIEFWEVVALCCSDLVQKGWLKRVPEAGIFPGTFWVNPQRDQYAQVQPTADLMLLMRRHFDNLQNS